VSGRECSFEFKTRELPSATNSPFAKQIVAK